MELFECSEVEKSEILKSFNKQRKDVENDVKILQDWYNKQPHLPPKFPFDNFLEKFLWRNKFRLEQTKEKIDNYFTLKRLNKEFYEIFCSKNRVSPLQNSVVFVSLPKLGPNFERIFLLEISPNAENYEFHHFSQILLFIAELALRYDFSNGYKCVINTKNYTKNHLRKASLTRLSRLIILHKEGYSSRLKGLEFINLSPSITLLLNVFKSLVNRKIVERIRFHKDLESLQKSVGKQCLPIEYGGEQESITLLQKRTEEAFWKNKQILEESSKFVSNEELRIGRSRFGDHDVQGCFRKLEVD